MQLFYVYTTFMLFVTFATANPVADSVAVEALVEVAKTYANMGKKNSDTGQLGKKISKLQKQVLIFLGTVTLTIW